MTMHDHVESLVGGTRAAAPTRERRHPRLLLLAPVLVIGAGAGLT